MDKSPVEIGKAVEGMRIGAALPGVQGELYGMEQALIARVFGEIEKKALSPEQALWAWMELYSYRRLVRRLSTRAALGTAELETLTQEATNG